MGIYNYCKKCLYYHIFVSIWLKRSIDSHTNWLIARIVYLLMWWLDIFVTSFMFLCAWLWHCVWCHSAPVDQVLALPRSVAPYLTSGGFTPCLLAGEVNCGMFLTFYRIKSCLCTVFLSCLFSFIIMCSFLTIKYRYKSNHISIYILQLSKVS